MCQKHYSRKRRTGTVVLKKNADKRCAVCGDVVLSKNLCAHHYRAQLYGLTPKRRPKTNKKIERGFKQATGEDSMTTKQAINFFDGVAGLSKALNVYPSAIYRWGERPPKLRQFELERLTNGALKAD
jgi:hypothetical protein